MAACPIEPPSDYSLNMARDRLNDALMIFISECELSGEEIYDEIQRCVSETFQYYDKPRESLRRLKDLIDSQSDAKRTDSPSKSSLSWNNFFEYEHILGCPDLAEQPDPYYEDIITLDLDLDSSDRSAPEVYNLSDRSIQAKSYQAIVRLFEEAFKRDVRSCSFETDLFSSDGMDLLIAELIELWNDYIIPSIVSTVNHELSKEESLSGVDSTIRGQPDITITNPQTHERRLIPRANKYDVYYQYNHIPTFQRPEDCVHVKTLFDLIHAYEQALEDHREYVNLIERCDY